MLLLPRSFKLCNTGLQRLAFTLPLFLLLRHQTHQSAPHLQLQLQTHEQHTFCCWLTASRSATAWVVTFNSSRLSSCGLTIQHQVSTQHTAHSTRHPHPLAAATSRECNDVGPANALCTACGDSSGALLTGLGSALDMTLAPPRAPSAASHVEVCLTTLRGGVCDGRALDSTTSVGARCALAVPWWLSTPPAPLLLLPLLLLLLVSFKCRNAGKPARACSAAVSAVVGADIAWFVLIWLLLQDRGVRYVPLDIVKRSRSANHNKPSRNPSLTQSHTNSAADTSHHPPQCLGHHCTRQL